jgi:hypothetical protein
MSTTQSNMNSGGKGTDGKGGDGTSSTLSGLKDTISSATETAKGQISSAAAAAKEKATAFIDPVKEKAAEMAERQKETGIAQVGRVAKAVHAAADQIEKDIPQAAGYIHRAAEGLEHASSAIQNRSVGEMVEFVEEFARRNPAAFFGSTVLAGFVLSRFLKSSSEHSRRMQSDGSSRTPSRAYANESGSSMKPGMTTGSYASPLGSAPTPSMGGGDA